MKSKALKLSPDFLAQCRKIAPLGIDEQHIEAMIDDIKMRGIRSDTDTAKRLHALIEPNLVLLKPERRALLLDTPVFVLPYKLCLSCVRLDKNGEGEVIITEGMIDLVAASIQEAALQHVIPAPLQEIPVGGTGQPLLTMLNMTTALLRYRFYRYAEALPDFSRVLLPEHSQQADISLRGALTFILLHELGHLQLDHIRTGEARLSHYDMVYEQRLGAYQFMEIEADEYAIGSLSEEAQDIGTYWMSQALSFFVTLELLSGYEEADHPLAINRQHAAERKRAGVRQLVPHPPVAVELAAHFRDTVSGNIPCRKPSILDAPREEIELAMREIIYMLRSHGVDLSSLLTAIPDP